MKQLTTAFSFIFIFGIQTLFAQQNNDILVGSKFNMYSSILDENRTCLISLPNS
ncbi:hypothetical protein K8089_02070 [Aequorivita sp. F47161]|uniref:Uncharacterized protein n=1 Tax=Aequorivita vitellina TaxID=2874475 RepID=A0A9X1QR56_9FLAO|nr:hypothetical protein [Aequorivita vitellina]MCG2417791.1 hypothetical protein [Aequorivita vitellina]